MKHLFTLNAKVICRIPFLLMLLLTNYSFGKGGNDAGITGISVPSSKFCEGMYNVTVGLKDFGNVPLKSAVIHWSVGSAVQASYSFGGTIKVDSTLSINIGSFAFSSGSNAIKVWSESPNGKIDSFPLNDTFLLKIIVNSKPTVNAGISQTVCSGDSVQLGQVGSAPVSGYTYQWTSNPAGYTSGMVAPYTKVQTSASYILSITNDNGCTALDSILITVNPRPAAIAGNPVTLCSGSSASIGNVSLPGNSYSWTSDPPSFTSTAADPVITPYGTAYYIVEVTNAANCTAKDSVLIMVNPSPGAIAGPDQKICIGESVKLGGPENPGSTYKWSSIPFGFNSFAVNPVVKPNSSTSYILTETDTATKCSNSHTAVITVNSRPNIIPIAGPNPVCAGTITGYAPDVAGTGLFFNYRISDSVGNQGDALVQSFDSLYIHWGTPGTVRLWMIAQNVSGCQDSTHIDININGVPKAGFSTNKVCAKTQTAFTNTSKDAVSSFWSFGDGDTLTASNPKHAYATGGKYMATVVVINAAGCYDSTTANVLVDSLPGLSFTSPASCLGSATTFTNTGGGSVKTYGWDFGDSTASVAKSPVKTYIRTGLFKVVLTETNVAGCKDTLSHFVQISPLPTNGGFKAIEGKSLTYTFVAEDSLNTSLTWDFGDSTPAVVGFRIIHAYKKDGSYHVKLTVTNPQGCSVTKDSVFKVDHSGIANEWFKTLDFKVSPNPFSDKTILTYHLSETSETRVKLVDIAGREITQIAKTIQAPGNYSIIIDTAADQLKPGVYFLNFAINGADIMQKIMKVE